MTTTTMRTGPTGGQSTPGGVNIDPQPARRGGRHRAPGSGSDIDFLLIGILTCTFLIGLLMGKMSRKSPPGE